MYRVPEPEKRQIHHQVDLWMPEYFMFHFLAPLALSYRFYIETIIIILFLSAYITYLYYIRYKDHRTHT